MPPSAVPACNAVSYATHTPRSASFVHLAGCLHVHTTAHTMEETHGRTRRLQRRCVIRPELYYMSRRANSSGCMGKRMDCGHEANDVR